MYADLIALFREKFTALQEYARDVLNIEVSTTWKIHIIGCHVEQWLDRHPVGLGVFAEQTSEAAHKDFEKTRKRFAVSESNSTHGAKLLRATVDHSSYRV